MKSGGLPDMMNKIFIGVLLLSIAAFSQITDNWNGYRDTSNITGFIGTGTKYSKAFNLTGYENLVVEVLADDTTTANLSADSIHFYWWIELGHLVLSSTNTVDTSWDIVNPIFVDTFNITVAGRRAITFRAIGTDYTFSAPSLTVDTASVTGFASQRRYIVPECDQYFRIGHKGLASNNKDADLKLRDNVWRRAATITRNR